MFCLQSIKALAILLVTNSHLREFYPVREISTGGVLGNCLFFFASGFAITLSLTVRPGPFLRWYARRLERIYLQLWIVTGLLVAAGLVTIKGWPDLVANFLFPMEYWFLPAIAVLYVPAFVLITRVPDRRLPVLLGAILAAYVIASVIVADPGRWSVEDHVLLKSLFYFAVMGAGISVARRPDGTSGLRLRGLRVLGLTLVFFGFLALLRMTHAYMFQSGANLLALAWTLAVFDLLRHPAAEAWLLQRFAKPVGVLGSLTLQIYLVQVPVIAAFGLERLPFPLNITLLLCLVLILAWLLDRGTTAVLARLRPREHHRARPPVVTSSPSKPGLLT